VKGANVTLAKTAKVTGDILHQTLAIEPGAFLEGHCKRIEHAPGDTKVSALRDKPAAAVAGARWAAASRRRPTIRLLGMRRCPSPRQEEGRADRMPAPE